MKSRFGHRNHRKKRRFFTTESTEKKIRNSIEDRGILRSFPLFKRKTKMSFWPQLVTVLHPNDAPLPSSWPRCYETKYAVASLLQPRTIFEIGVRTGYSAFAFLRAVPTARYLGIDANGDTHGGFCGAIEHARKLIEPYEAEVREMTSAQFATSCLSDSTQGYDLIHIDGDHSFAGCTFDLSLAVQLGFRHVLVDDYGGITEVREACEQFTDEHREELTQIEIQDGHNGALLISQLPGERGVLTP